MARILAVTLNPALDLSITLDRLVPGKVLRAAQTQSTPAGKGNNVARVLAAHGHEVVVSGFLGADNASVFETVFEQWSVSDAFIRVAGDTRTNVKLSEADGQVTDINAAGAGVDPPSWQRFEQAVDRTLDDGVDAVVVSGSLPPGIIADQLAALVRRVRQRDVALWLDTSGTALKAGLAACPSATKPNVEELAQWAGSAAQTLADCERAASALQRAGVADVFVSRGADGVLWVGKDESLTARAPAVNVVSTVCAGDTLIAGLLHGRLSGWDKRKTLLFATALATDAVRRIGVGRSDVSDFDALYKAVRIDTLAAPCKAVDDRPDQSPS
ncbi:MAG: 1-phosphofructokinase [Salinisphaera sp.]|jgi:1-phosphofructokinase|nr:1-phosphofructokinase [Salinisphaera sp.]